MDKARFLVNMVSSWLACSSRASRLTVTMTSGSPLMEEEVSLSSTDKIRNRSSGGKFALEVSSDENPPRTVLLKTKTINNFHINLSIE